jgi:hypothetical protein
MRIGLTAKGNFRRNNYTGDSNYWTGAMGWGYNTASTVSGWGNGFFDVWGVGTGDGWPPSTSHFEGIQAYHYTYGGGGYGWQMVNGGGAESVWFRPSWYGYGNWRNFAFYGVNSYSDSFYSTIVYDSNNTGYYSDPNGTCNFNQVQSDRTYGFSDIRSPIFYNYGDTGYYCDPNSVSQLAYVMANDWFRPQGGCGLYHNSYGHGLWAPESEGNPYGNWTTYTGGRNGWQGWGIQSHFTFMGRSGTDVGVHDSSYGWIWYQVYGGGTFMVGTSGNSGHRLYVNGAIYATSDITAFSDRRVKKNIVTIDGALDKVLNLRGVYYERIMRPKDLEAIGENTLKLEGTDRQVGVIAQEVLEVVPELVTYDPNNDEYGVKYANTVGLLIEAIKELNNQVIELKQELAEIKKD